MANTALYAGAGAILSTIASSVAGYALAKFQFPGRSLIFYTLIGGVLVPSVVLAVPQYLLLAKFGLANTYWAVLLPSIFHQPALYNLVITGALLSIIPLIALPDHAEVLAH
jgi:multiple sugar transport system permease protein